MPTFNQTFSDEAIEMFCTVRFKARFILVNGSGDVRHAKEGDTPSAILYCSVSSNSTGKLVVVENFGGYMVYSATIDL